VHAEDLLVDDGSDGKTREALCECLPQLNVVSSFAFVVESVDAVDRGAFVVASEEKEVLRVFNFVSQQETDGLQTLLSSIYIVSQKEIVCLRGKSSVLEQAEEIIILSVDVPADLDGRFEFEQDGLCHEELPGLCAQSANLCFGELHLLSWFASSHFEQSLDDAIDIEVCIGLCHLQISVILAGIPLGMMDGEG